MTDRPRIRIDVLVPSDATVGEGPVWDVDTSTLLWVDIPRGTMYRSAPHGVTTAEVKLPFSLGAVALTSDGTVVAACEQGVGLLDGHELDLRIPIRVPGERMNDAKVDPAGRLWAGSTAIDFAPGRGSLHVVTPDWQHCVAATGFVLPNGLDWSPDGTTFYLADSMRQCVYAYDFDVTDGALGERRNLITFDVPGELPDGLTVDTDGCVWLAIWGGARVVRIAPDGTLLATVDIPVRQPSSCTFGGSDLSVLYVTSARDGVDAPEGSLDGSVFAVTGLGTAGHAPHRFGGELA